MYSGIHNPQTAGAIIAFIFLLIFFSAFVGLLIFSIYNGSLFFTVLAIILMTATFFALGGHILIMYHRKVPEEESPFIFSDEDSHSDSGDPDLYRSDWGSEDIFTPDSTSIEN